MTQMKILITDNFTDNGIESLSTSADVVYQPGMSADDLLENISAYDALIVRGRTKVNADIIAAASKLKVIGRAGVGVDNIDLASAQSRNITVVNTPTATTIAVAEHTLALIMAIVRSVARSDAAMKSGRWIKQDILGMELSGKTLGIVGLGYIGLAVSLRAAAFGLKVIAHDPKKTDEFISKHGAESVTLTDLYTRADIVSLHVPLGPKTRHMINGQAFAQMKRGVYLICTARGGIINETALLSALENGQVAGAALDVFSQEPPDLTALVSHPNVIATPHIAAQTHQAQARAAADIAEEVLTALRGEPLRWKIV